MKESVIFGKKIKKKIGKINFKKKFIKDKNTKGNTIP